MNKGVFAIIILLATIDLLSGCSESGGGSPSAASRVNAQGATIFGPLTSTAYAGPGGGGGTASTSAPVNVAIDPDAFASLFNPAAAAAGSAAGAAVGAAKGAGKSGASSPAAPAAPAAAASDAAPASEATAAVPAAAATPVPATTTNLDKVKAYAQSLPASVKKDQLLNEIISCAAAPNCLIEAATK